MKTFYKNIEKKIYKKWQILKRKNIKKKRYWKESILKIEKIKKREDIAREIKILKRENIEFWEKEI